jgi:TRAP-type C4-dicarboxylate transport system substrate-binding protein
MSGDRIDIRGRSTEQANGEPKSARRAFMRVVRDHGSCVAALVAASNGFAGLGIRDAAAQTADEERAKRSAASHVMVTAIDGLLDRYPEGSVTRETIYTSGSILLKRLIERNSGGRIYVDLKPGGSLGFQAVGKVQQGVIQACNATTQNCASIVPIWNLLDFPFEIGNGTNMTKVFYSKEINASLRRKSEERGLIMLCGTPFMRWLHFGASATRDVTAPEGVKGLKIRVTNSKLELTGLQILGANPTPVGGGEIVTAMSQGMIDGYNIGPHLTVDFNLLAAVKQVVDVEFMPNTDCVWVGTKWMRGLPQQMQGAIMDAAFELQQHLVAEAPKIYTTQVGVEKDSPANSPFRQSAIRVHRLSEAQRNGWKDAMGFERNAQLKELVDQFGRTEFETVRRVVKEGTTAPNRWWL